MAQPLSQRTAQIRARAESGTPEHVAICKLDDLLHADYGRGLRGWMLIEEDASLPEPLGDELTALKLEHRRRLDEWLITNQQIIDEYRDKRPFRKKHLDALDFEKLMSIEIALHEHERPFQPLRIFAYRFDNATEPEEANLYLVSKDGSYSIEFLRDHSLARLPRKRVCLSLYDLNAAQLKNLSLRDLNDSSSSTNPQTNPQPGSVPSQTAGYTERGEGYLGLNSGKWQACSVLDSSPFGLVIHWADATEPVYPIVPRAHVRRQFQ